MSDLRSPLEAAYARWLGPKPFALMITGTVDPSRPRKKRIGQGLYSIESPGFVHPEQFTKQFHRWVNIGNRELLGNHWERRDPGIQSFAGFERQKRGELHFHTLLAHPSKDLRSDELKPWRVALGQQWWRDMGFCKIEFARSVEEGAAYCAKYTSKGGDTLISPSVHLLDCSQFELLRRRRHLGLAANL